MNAFDTKYKMHGPLNGIITYDFLHGLGRWDLQSALSRINPVMDRFAKPSIPSGAEFLLDLAADDDPILNAAYEELCRAYGKQHKTTLGYHVDKRVWRAFQWPLKQEQIDGALSYAAELHQRHPILAERAGVQVWWEFRFLDPETRLELPNQDPLPTLDIRRPGGSQVGVTFKRTTAAARWLCFPFLEPSPDFLAYVQQFQSALPFQLSSKHWKNWRRDSAGEWKPRKFSPG